MWRDVPFSGLYWYGYETVRNQISDARERMAGRGHHLDAGRVVTGKKPSQTSESHSVTFVNSFFAGALSGGFAAFVTTPFDVGKTRKQTYTQLGDDGFIKPEIAKSANKLPEQMTMPRFLYHIFQKEGPSGLFRGWAARCLKIAPACAIMISSYEVGKKWARHINERKRDEAMAA
jgi:solute carrier family 25 protein 39/40